MINIGDYAFAYCNSLEEITIPARYIGDYAFIHCGLEKVTLSEHVKYIFSNAFSGCGLKKVSCNGVTPPDIINYCTIHTPFDYYWHVADDQQKVSPLNCRLYVPSEAIGAYEKALGWGQGYTSKDELYDDGLRKYYFQIIKSKEFEDEEIEEKPSDVSVPLTDKLSFSVYGDDRCIVIDCMDGDAVFEVYGIGGSRIYEGTDRRIAVPQPGLYIVRSDGKTRKVIVQ